MVRDADLGSIAEVLLLLKWRVEWREASIDIISTCLSQTLTTSASQYCFQGILTIDLLRPRHGLYLDYKDQAPHCNIY